MIPAGSERQVFITPRSEDEFDELMRNLPEDVHVHIYPGCRTRGWHAGEQDRSKVWSPKKGWEISGVGRGTHLTLVGNDWKVSGAIAIGTEYNDNADGCYIHDLTIDCNHQGQPAKENLSTAIYVQGSHTCVERVHAVNFGTTVSSECFVIFLASGNLNSGACRDQRVVDCLIDNPSPTSSGGGIMGVNIAGIGTGGLIRGNWIEGGKIVSAASASTVGAVIEGNYFVGTNHGIYTDTGNVERLTVRHNHFLNTLRGLWVDFHDRGERFYIRDLVIEGNEFDLRAEPDATGVNLLGHNAGKYGMPRKLDANKKPIPYCFKNVLVRNNNFRAAPGQVCVGVYNCETLRMEGNTKQGGAIGLRKSIVRNVFGQVIEW